ncbi:uncharacterized protein Triagg1_1384 [Trichoderma aggressivum f. europaeum]|uniref:Uncharacterized protein n=1 Tax=Trichoderma aggressivum f. europaeum TaxID=173218 RepID=A0AAE1M6F5_9HYPO|nr:hypothetical protein Triagg1_1384 [Trichoderma aggressivum f. europaeum]
MDQRIDHLVRQIDDCWITYSIAQGILSALDDSIRFDEDKHTEIHEQERIRDASGAEGLAHQRTLISLLQDCDCVNGYAQNVIELDFRSANLSKQPGEVRDLRATPVEQSQQDVANNIVRIGPQRYVSNHSPIIKSIPLNEVKKKISKAVRINITERDQKMPGATQERMNRLHAAISLYLVNSFDQTPQQKHGNDLVKRHCDYTGAKLLWTPGPFSMSVEAIYPIAIFEGKDAYHSPSNVCLVSTYLNVLKKTNPILLLPLIAVCLNISDSSAVTTYKQQHLWAYNAICNICTISTAFYTSSSPHLRAMEWESWEMPLKMAFLDASRTGIMGSEVEAMVQRLRPEQLFRPRKHEYFGEPANYKIRQHSWDWKHVYINLLRIADHYGITESEFEYYLTVSSPEQDKVTDRIFYFYHILSKVQAEAIDWNWETLRRVVQCMLYTLKNECNKYAEEAGLGEDMDQFKVIYWIAGHYCKQIQRLKLQYPEWTMEDIGFRAFLDRWGLPLVPWTSHPLKSSLCKKQDHGICMLFGLREQEEFNPVTLFDWDSCTITIDTVFTNFAMFNYSSTIWNDIRANISSIPLHHCFWRVDQDLGNVMWSGLSYSANKPMPPTPEFDVELLPLTTLAGPFKCIELTVHQLQILMKS